MGKIMTRRCSHHDKTKEVEMNCGNELGETEHNQKSHELESSQEKENGQTKSYHGDTQ